MTWRPDICVFHAGCDDGFASAWVCWRMFGNSVAFVPGAYGRNIPWSDGSLEGKNILFVDFSLKREAMMALAKGQMHPGCPKSIVVLDHHKTAQAELAQWSIGPVKSFSYAAVQANIVQAVAEQGYPIVAHFDMSCSGARMTWDFLHEREDSAAPPMFIALVEDRDLWRFAYGDKTRQFSAALRTYAQDFEVWDRLAVDPTALVDEGASILRGHSKNVAAMCEHAYLQLIGGFRVPVVNCPYHYASDVANELLQRFPQAPFAAAWFRRGDGMLQFSLRSEDSRRDVSEIAALYQGGGHRNAAGYAVSAVITPKREEAA